MPVKEHATNQKVVLLMNSTIGSDTVTYSGILDTANYDDGVYFAFSIVAFDNTAADCTCVVQEGDASNMSDAVTVDATKLVYGGAVVLDAVNAVGANLKKEGVFSTKRYLRVAVTSLGIDVSSQVVILAVVNPEVLPTAQV